MQYKINEPIRIRYLELNKTPEIDDLLLTITKPSGTDLSPIVLNDIGNGLYEVIFIPNAIGWWWAKVTSISHPLNIYSKSYFVGIDYTDYLAREDGNIKNIKEELQILNNLIPSKYDNISLTYDGDNLSTVVFKLGGVTISTLTLGYASGKLISVIKS